MPRLALCIFAVLLAAAPRAFAQEYSPLRWYLMGGANATVGSTSDLLQTGYNLGVAVVWREPGRPVGIRLDLNYASNNATRALQSLGSAATGLNITGGWSDIWSASVNLEAQHLFSSTTYGYLIGGIGLYYTEVQLTEYGYGYVCNPWWGYCYSRIETAPQPLEFVPVTIGLRF